MDVCLFMEELEELANKMIKMAHDIKQNYYEKDDDPGIYIPQKEK